MNKQSELPKMPPPKKPQPKRLAPKSGVVKNTSASAREAAKKEKRQRILMVVMIILAVIMVIADILVLLHNRWVKKPVLPDPPAPIQSDSGGVPSTDIPPVTPGPDDPPATVTVQPLAGGERKSPDFYTILIFGTDTSSGLTDTIMVASYDVTNQKATVLSIPRDTLVNNRYLEKGNKAINATYKQNGKGESGTAALKTEVSRLIGFVPDFYVTINWNLVGKMVDAIGGVYFDVPYHMGYDDPTQNLHIHFEKGYQYLDGKAAMNLVRWRKNNDGTSSHGGSDLSRLNVQHDFLKAVLKQTLQPQNIIRVPELIRLFNENVVSDLTVENMLWFGEQAVIGGLGVDDVSFISLPVYATENTSGRYYGKYCPNVNQLLKVVNSSVNPYVEEVTLQQLDLIQMSADGNILSSTTGTLRNPAAGVFTYPDAPSDPVESDPGAAGPESGGSDPGRTDDSSPGTGPALPDGDGPADGNWGYTPD